MFRHDFSTRLYFFHQQIFAQISVHNYADVPKDTGLLLRIKKRTDRPDPWDRRYSYILLAPFDHKFAQLQRLTGIPWEIKTLRAGFEDINIHNRSASVVQNALTP